MEEFKVAKNDGMYTRTFGYFKAKYAFNFFIGGRGTGKTYSTLNDMLDYADCPLFLRRTHAEMVTIMDTKNSPAVGRVFKMLSDPYKRELCMFGKPSTYGVICTRMYDEVEEKWKYNNSHPLGYASTLMTMQKRGIEMAEVDFIFLDEFIRKKNERRTFKNEYDALMDTYDTVNRNREFDGYPPVYLFACSNSNSIYNDIFKGFGVVNSLENLLRRNSKEFHYYDSSKSLAIHLLPDTDEFLKKRSESVVAKATQDTEYGKMSVGNEFSYDDFTNVGRRSIQGCYPVCSHEDMYVYASKGQNLYYLSYSHAYCKHFKNNSIDNSRFYSYIGHTLANNYGKGRVYFESYELKMRFIELCM